MKSDVQAWLIDAIENRRLAQYWNGQEMLLLEPHICGRVPGKGDVVIGFQVPRQRAYHSAPDGAWLELPIDEVSQLETEMQFSAGRKVLPHLEGRLLEVYYRGKAV